MKLKVYSIILFLFVLTKGVAQDITFKVYSFKNQLPIANVKVITSKSDVLGFTNSKGVLSVTLKNSKSQIIFLNENYKILEIDVDTKIKPVVAVYLESLGEVISEVVIRAIKKQNYAVTVLEPVKGTHIYAGKKSEVVNLDLIDGNKASNNARQIFSKVVGLNIYEANDGGLQLNIGGRGLDPNRTANFNTRQNDYDISADVLGYPESYYTPATEGLSQIQVIRGAASLQYGTQFGGLINFVTRKPSSEPIEFTTRNTVSSFNSYSNFTSIGGTLGKFSYYTYYNGKTGDGFRPNSEYDSDNIFTHLNYQFNQKTNLAFEYTYFDYLAHQPGGLSDVQFLEDPKQSYFSRNWFDVNWNLFNLKLNHEFNNKNKITLSVFALEAARKAVGYRGVPGADNPRIFNVNGDAINEFGEFEFQRDLLVDTFSNWGAEARFLSNYKIGNQDAYLLLGAKVYNADNSARQGAGSKNTDADFNFIEAAQYPNQNNFDFPNFNTSLFGEHIFNLSSDLSITPGFRFEHINTQSKGQFYVANTDAFIPDNNAFIRNFILLGVGLSYKPKTYFELYSNASQNYRSVTFSNIRTVNPSFIIDPDITDEEGYTFDFGVRGKYKKHIAYDVNVFSILYDNRIGQVLNNRAQWVRKNIGTAFIYGLESLVQWNIKETFFKQNEQLTCDVFSNLSLTESEYTDSDENNVEGNQVEYIPSINLRTGINIGWKNLLFGMQYTAIGEQFTDVTNSPYNPSNATDVIGAIPNYDILDASLSYTFSKNFKLETGLNNALDNSYFTRRATGYPGPGIIPSAPRNWYATLQIQF